MSDLTEYDREILRLENSLAAALERAKRAEELLATERKKHALAVAELTTQIMDPEKATQQIYKMGQLLEQKNATLEVLTKRIEDMRKELVGMIDG